MHQHVGVGKAKGLFGRQFPTPPPDTARADGQLGTRGTSSDTDFVTVTRFRTAATSRV